MARLYPALDLRWPDRRTDELIERLLSNIDDESPTAVEALSGGVRVFFSSAAERDRAARRLSALDPALIAAGVDVSDEDWAERSQASLTPVRVGRIVVVPRNDIGSRFLDGPSEKTTPDVVLLIQPSMGFGTGHHASTRLCLMLLQQIQLDGTAVLDVGTGSGVLALAARKLGARRVVAIDPDLNALRSAEAGVDLNSELGAITLRAIDLEHAPTALGGSFDVVLANLTGTLLCREARLLAELTAPGGRLIASGFQRHEAGEVRAAFSDAGLALIERADEDDWVGVIAAREPAATSPTHSTAR